MPHHIQNTTARKFEQKPAASAAFPQNLTFYVVVELAVGEAALAADLIVFTKSVVFALAI